MKRLEFTLATALLYMFTVFLSCAAVANDSNDKIPITTKSKKASELYLKGRDLQERLRVNDALPYFEQSVSEDPDFALGHYGCALSAPSAKAFFASLEKAAALAENASEGEKMLILGFKAGVDGNTAKQAMMFEKLVQLYPNDERSHNTLGGFYFGQQKYEDAIKEYNKAVEINPGFSQPYNQLGYAYRFLGHFDQALATFKKYIEVLPNDPNPYDSYAELLLKLGRYDESIKNYRKALTVSSDFVASHLGIATNFNYKGEHDAAREQLDKMYSMGKNNGQRRAALFAKSISYIFENDLSKALAEQQKMYDLAAKINDVAAMSGDLTTMGNILVQFDRADDAKSKYEASLEMVMKSDLSEQQKALARQFHHANLFQVAENKRDLKAAHQQTMAFKEQAESVKNTFQIRLAHEMLGRIALLEKDYGTAIAELKQANQQNPLNLYRTGLAYEGKGDQAQAKTWFKQAADLNPVNNMNQAFLSVKMSKMDSSKS